MLVLSRKVDESIVLGDGLITLRVVSIRGDKCKIGIEAPKEMRVDREEIHLRRREDARRAKTT